MMQEAKNTARALVRIAYDGSVHKTYRAAQARERFENELKVLTYLEERGCEFVPRVLDYDRENLVLVTSNCGTLVEQISDEKLKQLFAELEEYGVRHDDPFQRNITYRNSDGRFCVIDFEFATILDEASGQPAQGDLATARNTNLATQAGSATQLRLRWAGATDRGRFRPNNEDAFLALSFSPRDFYYLGNQGEAHVHGMDFVFAVSDGMGGERSGEFASRFTIDNITRLLPRRFQLSAANRKTGIRQCLADLYLGIHRQLTNLGQTYEEGRNMGATLSLLWYASGWLYLAHIGDGRIYQVCREGGLRQLTDDHTHVGWLRRRGEINEREHRSHPRKNVLSQALGADNQTIRPQIGEIRCEPGDRFLLCTDGVIEGIWDHRLETLLQTLPPGEGPDSPASRIVQEAVAESGADNATAVVVDILEAAVPLARQD